MTQSLRQPMIIQWVNHLLEYGCAADRDCRICVLRRQRTATTSRKVAMPPRVPVPIGWPRCLTSPQKRVAKGPRNGSPSDVESFSVSWVRVLLGIVLGAKVQNVLGNVVGSGLGGLLPVANSFRIYSVSGTYPVIPRDKYRLVVVDGLVPTVVPRSLWPISRPCPAPVS